ncbi:zonular occludens toxin domain-containing protein [Shewanella xiamenensis]|uniref:zonular occludens toxin domain-containing protein n=1 Tax=Shewanella xiamenensis TaxID=332186 RepID=UPI0021C14BCD|nr:zonular occludens toxin domain-containing protein [Shewanella xiamenensis]MCT8866968.1 zona occludens toxin-like protein [Shewanella xiamenensis]
MSSIFVHGAPGSYKSASTLWFEMLPALREGRLVITNIEGLKPLETIEGILCEKFPPSAKLWRISTQNALGLSLMRRFWCWAPVGAFILLDEVQGLYPSAKIDKTFKLESLTKIEPDKFEGLPDFILQEYYARLDDVSPATLSEGDIDDLGISLFDDNGHIIYPADISDAFNRHRKYNWDLAYCTPFIEEVHPLIRGIADIAYAYKHNDALGKIIPYYDRRPRIYPHKPSESGSYVPQKAAIFTRKVPEKVFSLYKSTSTGAVTAQTKGKTPFSDIRFIGVLFVLLGVFIYYIWFFFIFETPTANPDQPDKSAEMVGQAAPAAAPANPDIKSDQTHVRGASSLAPVPLPYNSKELFLTGVISNFSQNRFLMSRDYFFELRGASGAYAISSDLLTEMGWSFEYKHECLVVAKNGPTVVNAVCLPRETHDFVPREVAKNDNQPSVSIF